MSLIAIISERASDLTPNERRLVEAVLADPKAVAFGTGGDLARDVGVHEATLSRLVRKLGFGSYGMFRAALKDEFIPTRETATRFQKTLNGSAESSTILGKLAQDEIVALHSVEEHIRPEQIKRVAETLMTAPRVSFYGFGNAEVLAALMVKRFRRFGRSVQQLSADPRTLAEQALGFVPGEAVLLFAFRRPPRAYAAIIDSAREAGAATIVVTSNSGVHLTPPPDQMLVAPRSGDPDGFQTLTVPMTVCNAIVIAAGLTAKEETLKKLDRLGQLIERFD